MLAYSADVPMNWAGAYVASPTAPVTDWAIRVGATALTSGLADLSRRAPTSFMVRSVVRLIVPVRDRPPAAGPKPDDRLGVVGHVGLVGDHHDGAALGVEPAEQRQHVLGGDGVEVAGGLVGQDQGGIGGDGAGDRHPLLLAAGQLRRHVVDPV